MQKKKRGFIDTTTIITTLAIAALFEVFKATIRFLWTKILIVVWPKKKKDTNLNEGQNNGKKRKE
jgi:hypothetical protein